MGSPDDLEKLGAEFLHFGIKGMRWGVRRDNPGGPTAVKVATSPGGGVKASGGEGHRPSKDAVAAAKLRQRTRKSSVRSLTNAELKVMINRMNLEKQYSDLKGDNAVRKGLNVVKEIVGAGKLAFEVHGLVKKVAGK
jgi:hypothetical protein